MFASFAKKIRFVSQHLFALEIQMSFLNLQVSLIDINEHVFSFTGYMLILSTGEHVGKIS